MSDPQNPYSVSKAAAAPGPAAVTGSAFSAPLAYRLHEVPTARPPADGWLWLQGGWALFRQASALQCGLFWLLLLVTMGISLVATFIPFAATLLMWPVQTLMTAGLVLCLRGIEAGEDVPVSRLFAGFSHPRRGALMLLGLVLAGFSLLNGLVAAWVVGDPALFLEMEGAVSSTAASDRLFANMELMLWYYGIMTLIGFTVMTFTAYATVLVLDHGLNPAAALLASVRAILVNLVPVAINSVLVILLLLGSAFTLFFGLIVLLPFLMAVWWVSYRRIFTHYPAA